MNQENLEPIVSQLRSSVTTISDHVTSDNVASLFSYEGIVDFYNYIASLVTYDNLVIYYHNSVEGLQRAKVFLTPHWEKTTNKVQREYPKIQSNVEEKAHQIISTIFVGLSLLETIIIILGRKEQPQGYKMVIQTILRSS